MSPHAKIWNFSPGPAMLPESVMRQAQRELLDWHGHGASIMELSHRSPEFMEVAIQAEDDLRELYSIPSNYHVLFLAGGASHQFSMIPLNLAGTDDTVDFLHTGHWSHCAYLEARRYCNAHLAWSNGDAPACIPPHTQWSLNPKTKYIHIAMNETLHGLEFPKPPDCGDTPLVADMTSTFLSRPLDISRFGLLFAGGQKNFAPAGLTVVIVREDLVGHARKECPHLWNYAAQAQEGSLMNTPPTFNWYMAGLNFAWLKSCGGLAKAAERNRRKAMRLYECIDESALYSNPVDLPFRSWMNVFFRLADEGLDERFLDETRAAGLLWLRGHKRLGGMRASLYNAMPEEGVNALISFMKEFERKA